MTWKPRNHPKRVGTRCAVVQKGECEKGPALRPSPAFLLGMNGIRRVGVMQSGVGFRTGSAGWFRGFVFPPIAPSKAGRGVRSIKLASSNSCLCQKTCGKLSQRLCSGSFAAASRFFVRRRARQSSTLSIFFTENSRIRKTARAAAAIMIL